ncbi:glutamate--tRNA ligase [bacterium]|nr:glutamate--tRNA ligase [bacterium]
MKVRFAPSPTGYLHIGGLRTALYNYLFAKNNNAKLLLRIEDTDRNRYVKNADQQIIKTLKSFGIEFDEGPFYQSQRLEIYQKYVKQLVKEDKAYYCFCSKERLDEMRSAQIAEKKIPKYDRHCLNLSEEEIKKKLDNKESYVVRLKLLDNQDVIFKDEVYGEVKINTNNMDDQVLLKSDGYPTYHLAVVVDDHEMDITHIIRGEEWLPSTPKHILLYQMFNWEIPKFIHLPLLLNPDKSKLSKRQGDVAAEDFLKKGYLPEAILNYIAFLGWNPKTTKEIYSIEELIRDFDIAKINKAGAIFNIEKLNWFNAEYVRNIVKEKGQRYEKLLEKSKKYFPKNLEKNKLENIFIVLSSRLNYLSELEESSKFIFELPDYDSQMLIFKKSDLDKTKAGLKLIYKQLENNTADWELENLDNLLKNIVNNSELNPGDVFWPLRVALSGLDKSPSPSEILWILEKNESLDRINIALNKLK